MIITLIFACSDNAVIGRDNWMPWRQSADLRRFRERTTGHHLLMGRKTFAALPQPLPGREHLVLSRTASLNQPGVYFYRELDAALDHARQRGENELFVTGGGEIYRLTLPLADRIEVTRIHTTLHGDVTFSFNTTTWHCLDRQGPFAADAKNDYPYSFETWVRRAQPLGVK